MSNCQIREGKDLHHFGRVAKSSDNMELKNLKSIKGIGYSLLIVGLLFIIYSVYPMYSVYTGAQPPPSVIHMNSVKFSLPTGPGVPPGKQN